MADAGTEFLRSSLRNTSFEQQFNCLICWTPSLRMIYGSCQHRLCENCLYDEEGNRRIGLEKCPTCQREDVFPLTRPDVPEDNMEIQYRLGIRRCPNSGCDLQMWSWELSDHIFECRFVNELPSGKKEITEKSSQSEDKTMEIHVNKPMALRSQTKSATTNKKDNDRATARKRYKLRSRRGQRRMTTV